MLYLRKESEKYFKERSAIYIPKRSTKMRAENYWIYNMKVIDDLEKNQFLLGGDGKKPNWNVCKEE